jgi:succinoglycan biosynthesis protein ExoM
MTYSICIAAYRRPDGLTALLQSLLSQEIPPATIVEIIVVDNDPDASAKPICDQLELGPPFVLTYLRQPVKNISLTRNLAVHAATGDALFFIDDDEIAAPCWIKELASALDMYHADAVFGAVIPLFPPGTPAWVRSADIFKRPLAPRGEDALATPSGNCAIRATALAQERGPFDPAYGTTGGEDSHLFRRLRLKGLALISVPEARIEEAVAPQRMRIPWMLRRAYRTGNTSTRITLSVGPYHRLARLRLGLRSIMALSLSGLISLVVLPCRAYWLHWTTRIYSNLGHLAAVFGVRVHEY